MGGKRIRSLKVRAGQECSISRGTRLSSEGTQAGGIRGSRSAGRSGISRRSRDVAGVAALGVRAAKSSESRKGEQ